MNQYDEIKKLLNNSRNMLGKNNLQESRKDLIELGLIKEQEANDPVNLDADIEGEIDIETTPEEDKSQKYRVSGGIINLHGKTKQDLELTSDEKIAFQETMDEFVDQVSDLADFGILNVYPNNVEWSGKIIDKDIEFMYSIGESSGVYINGNMLKLDQDFLETINKLSSYYEQFKAKWGKVISQRKKTQDTGNE
jgi:hypothetical protein